MAAPFKGRHIGLLLDLDPTSSTFSSILLFWSDSNDLATLKYRGVLAEGLPRDQDFRLCVSASAPAARIQCRRFSDGCLPSTVRDLIPWSLSSHSKSFAVDTSSPFQGASSHSNDQQSVIQDGKDKWNSRYSLPLPHGNRHFVLAKLEKTDAQGYVMLGFWENDHAKLAKARTEHAGQAGGNGGFAFYLHGNRTVYYGDKRLPRISPSLQMAAPFTGRYVGLLLDLDPKSSTYLSIILMWSETPDESTLQYKGILVDGLKRDTEYRFCVSTFTRGAQVSWQGFSGAMIPESYLDTIPSHPSEIEACYAVDTTFKHQGQFISAIDPFCVQQDVNDDSTWNTRFSHPILHGSRHYIQTKLDIVNSSGLVMLGFWEDTEHRLKLSSKQHAGQEANGGFAFNVNGNRTVYFGDGRASRVLADMRMKAPYVNRHIGLLLDLDPKSVTYRAILLFWSDSEDESTLKFKGVLAGGLEVNKNFRFCIGMQTVGTRVAWGGCMNEAIPQEVMNLIPESIQFDANLRPITPVRPPKFSTPTCQRFQVPVFTGRTEQTTLSAKAPASSANESIPNEANLDVTQNTPDTAEEASSLFNALPTSVEEASTSVEVTAASTEEASTSVEVTAKPSAEVPSTTLIESPAIET